VASVEVLWGAGSASGTADIVGRVTGVSSAVAVAIFSEMGEWTRGEWDSSVDDSCDAVVGANGESGGLSAVWDVAAAAKAGAVLGTVGSKVVGVCVGRDSGSASERNELPSAQALAAMAGEEHSKTRAAAK
jgi:hypothetical protein